MTYFLAQNHDLYKNMQALQNPSPMCTMGTLCVTQDSTFESKIEVKLCHTKITCIIVGLNRVHARK